MNGHTRMMRAATVVEHHKPVEILEVPVPAPGPCDILVKITASSLCMSDVAALKGAVPTKVPFCVGHEPVGIIEELGSGVRGFKVGDRVGFAPSSNTCQDCADCLSGGHRFCDAKKQVGFEGPYGGFSEYCLADPLSTVKIPEGLTDEEAAPLLCAGVTAYGAIHKVSKAQPGGTAVNIIGVGGVGHLAVQYAKAMGFFVRAFDITEDKLELAKKCGADEVFNSNDIKDFAPLRAFSTVVISGANAAYDLALDITKNRGQVVAVGVSSKPYPLDILRLVCTGIQFASTNQGDREELRDCLEIASKHGIKPSYQMRDFDKIGEGFDEMLGGGVVGRLIYRLS